MGSVYRLPIEFDDRVNAPSSSQTARNDIPKQVEELLACVDAADIDIRFPRADVCIAIPGYPVNGYEAFMQERGGPYMVRLSQEGRSAFLWRDEAEQWFVRPWSTGGKHDDGMIIQVAGTEDALANLERNFANTKKTWISRYTATLSDGVICVLLWPVFSLYLLVAKMFCHVGNLDPNTFKKRGPTCSYCGTRLFSPNTRQCLKCGMDWHDSENIYCQFSNPQGPN